MLRLLSVVFSAIDPEHYVSTVWSRRDFCWHLAMADIRSRFRRSHLGVLWAILQPMLLTTIMSVVLALVFKQPYKEFSLYVFSGLLVWDFFVSGINTGATSIISGEGYLRQTRLPLAIFPVKAVIFCSVFFACGLVAYVLYAAALVPASLSFYSILVLPIFALMFFFVMPLAIISSIVNTHFRDFQQFINLALQMLWYLSPVFVAREIFKQPALATWTCVNPVAAICDAIRDPLMYHRLPHSTDIALILAYSIFLWLIAIFMLRRFSATLIFRL